MSPRPIETPGPEFEPAMVMAGEGRCAEAVAWVLRALGSPPADEVRAAGAQALAKIARLAESRSDLETAERALEQALGLEPRYADLHVRHACLLVARNRRAEARGALERALRIHPRYLAARIELALLDAREGRIGEALSSLREIERDSRIEEPRVFQQALESLERADWDGAGLLFRRALRGADPHLDRQLERIGALIDEGALERAAEMLRGTLSHFPCYPDLHALLGSCELGIGHFDDAVASLARALEINPDFHAARIQLARALDALGERAQAADQVALVLQSDPAHAAALVLHESWSARGRRGSGRRNAGRKAS